MRCAAVVVAAGRGARFGAARNKVLLPLGTSTVLERSLDALASCEDVGAIVLVVGAADRAEVEARAERLGRGKVTSIVDGGARRIDSVAAGVRCAPRDAELIAIHDAARPLIDTNTIVALLTAAERCGGAVPASAATDTVKRTHDGATVAETLPRREIFLAQTPQVFRREPFAAALERAVASGRDFTDDAAVAEQFGISVEIVRNDAPNFKVTYPEDLARAESILRGRAAAADAASVRIGTGFDVHRLVAGRRCVLGGVEIASPVGPLGHSDGDALLHAVADALLGAAGLDDLGTLFPDKDPAYKNADSRELLRLCVERVRAAGFEVVNADAVLVLEAPKIAPHRAAMRASLADLLGVDTSRINIKGKTAEGLGPVGAGGAVVAQASVLLRCAAS